jgi:magnesium-transporting ATPase (P-type)
VDIIRAGKLDNVSWSNVRIGDICVIERENVFPADLLLLASSGEGGVAYI